MNARTWVVALTGAPGSGKSTTARELARLLAAALLDQDTMTNPLVDVVAGLLDVHGYDDERLARLVRAPRYECLLRVAADCVAASVPVVLVAPFTAERRDSAAWARFASEVDRFGGRPCLAWQRISPADLTDRLRQRSADRDVDKLRDLRSYVNSLDLSPPVVPFIEIDAVLPPAVQAQHLQQALNTRAPEGCL